MNLPSMLALTLLLPTTVGAQQAHHDHKSAYAGEEARPIKTLSEGDISELRRGGGWGLAKPAELNGMPGPSHALKMAAELKLSADQEGEGARCVRRHAARSDRGRRTVRFPRGTI